MSEAPGDSLRRTVERAEDGDAAAREELFALLYDELHRLAHAHVSRARGAMTWNTTTLLHEAYLKMARGASRDWKDRAHFLAVAARAMRQVLVNHARDRAAAKRGGKDRGERVTISGVAGDTAADGADVLAVHEALDDLAAMDPRPARVAELRVFAGLENREVAEALGVSLRTVELDWRLAKDFLAGRLGGTRAGGDADERGTGA